MDKFKVFITYPSSIASFMSKLLNEIHLSNVLEGIHQFTWKIKAMSVYIREITNLEFSSIECAAEQESHHSCRDVLWQVGFTNCLYWVGVVRHRAMTLVSVSGISISSSGVGQASSGPVAQWLLKYFCELLWSVQLAVKMLSFISSLAPSS